MKYKRKAMKCKGFTLIEAVIVIGIMAVLVVMAAPDLLNVMSDAKISADVASGRVIYEACTQELMKGNSIMVGDTCDKSGGIKVNESAGIAEALSVIPSCNTADNFSYTYNGDKITVYAGGDQVYPENELSDAK